MSKKSWKGQFADIDSMLANILCLPTAKHPKRESRRGRLSKRVLAGADEFVETSGVLAEVQRWYDEDHPDRGTNGGRPTVYDDRFRLVLTVLFALVFAGEDPLISRISEVVTSRLHTKSRDLLGHRRSNTAAMSPSTTGSTGRCGRSPPSSTPHPARQVGGSPASKSKRSKRHGTPRSAPRSTSGCCGCQRSCWKRPPKPSPRKRWRRGRATSRSMRPW